MHTPPVPAHNNRDDRHDGRFEPFADLTLRRQLESAAGRWFYESCDGVTQALLLGCSWHLTTHAPALTLVIDCPSESMYWRVLNHLTALGDRLSHLSSQGYIRVCPPPELGTPVEMRVDALPFDLSPYSPN